MSPDAAYYRAYRAKRKAAKLAVANDANDANAQTLQAPKPPVGVESRESVDVVAVGVAVDGEVNCGGVEGGGVEGRVEVEGGKAIKPLTPARAKGGRMVFEKRKPLCPPATKMQYQQAKDLMLSGLSLWETLQIVGCNRQAIVEAAYILDDWQGWSDVELANKAAVSARIAGEAIAAGVAQDRVTRTDDGDKETVKTERSVDVAALRLAGEHIAPEIHGKLASKQTTAVQVNIGLVDAISELEKLEAASRPTVNISAVEPTISCGGA